MPSKIHIGSLVEKQVRRQKMTTKDFREAIGLKSSQGVYHIYKQPDLNTETLYTISQVLRHDFFVYYSKKLKIK